MENLPVIMVLEDLTQLSEFRLPPGYFFRNYRKGDEALWIDVETAAGEFASFGQGRDRFKREFERYASELEDRLVFLETVNHECIGTAMGWFDDHFFREGYGRLHWVGIHPTWQGKGLARPLINRAMQIISERHKKAYLTTQTASFKAIKIYLDLGFRPCPETERSRDAWTLMAEKLNHPALKEFVISPR